VELFKQLDLTDLIKRALVEDVGQGDITTAATVAPGAMGRARITVKEARMILAGGILIEPVMGIAGAEPRMVALAPEGAELKAGDTVAEIEGRLAGLLIGERTALNFVQLLSGIATTTRDRGHAGEDSRHAQDSSRSARRREVRGPRGRRA
jgi:nicotinate-nucleotide pyrophosphorylase (carboxylating)